MLIENFQSSFLFGANAPYVEEQYEVYLTNPASVSDQWRAYFDALNESPAIDGTNREDELQAPVIAKFREQARRRPATSSPSGDELTLARKQIAVQSLITAYRTVGSRNADLDPLKLRMMRPLAELTPAYYGLAIEDMSTRFSTADTSLFDEDVSLHALVTALKQTYTGKLSSEFMHLTDASQRRWWQMKLESTRAQSDFTADEKSRFLERLTAAEGLEKYLHTHFVGQKRFSLEGGESLIVLLDEVVAYGASKGIRSAVMGMAHRGRLNVLINIAGKPVHALFDEFDDKDAKQLPEGDVKYHKGHCATRQTADGPVEVVLCFNPSHLEVVNPVVQGIARAKGDALGENAGGSVLPVEIHGDASMSGQGVVMETLALSYTRGYGTGGTLHVVVNNQIGFTTSDTRDARSSYFSTDIVKMIEAPVLHVNGDDPEAVALAVRLALEYRTEFQRSVVIDLVCFRRHGHQEQDTPAITQPLMYRAIARHPGVRALYAGILIEQGVLSAEQAEAYIKSQHAILDQGRNHDSGQIAVESRASASPVYRAPSLAYLWELAQRTLKVPDCCELHPLVSKLFVARGEMASGRRKIDWGMGEHLAFASLLDQGFDVRLSGQDSARGTFNQRHAVLHNQQPRASTDDVFIPLDHVGITQGRFTVINSVLSEAAVLAFEYGYSSVNRHALVVWEAQFGDFANGAQVVIDQFIAAGAVKWGQRSGLTLFLPHGQEGAGSEHASARLERYLQLSAQDNIFVVQPTTPAQFFHLLRKQALGLDRRPLIVMTPKSLLRHSEAVSSMDELADGAFNEILTDGRGDHPTRADVQRVILSSGKVYFDLLDYRRKHQLNDVSIIRVEQLYPFPSGLVAAEFAHYPGMKSVIWCQEEPSNQGAWSFVEPLLRNILPEHANLSYAGRVASAATAPGYQSVHAARQAEVINAAFRH